MNQNLSSYWIFYTVANAGNISKAARSSISASLPSASQFKSLRTDWNAAFFQKLQRCRLDRGGRLLYDHVSEAFEALNEGEEKLKRSIELGVGQLKIGVSSTLCKYMLLPYLKEFIHRNPHISISIECQSTNETLKLLDDDKIDIGLIGKPTSLKTFNFYYLDNIEDIFVTTKDYLRNLSARGVKKSEILQNSTLMLLDKGNMTRKYIDDYLQENQIHVKDSIDISNMDLLIDFAKIGVGVACVIKSIVSKELADGTLIEIPLGIPIHKREVGFAYKESSKLSTSLQTFIKFYESYTPEDF